MSDNSDNQEELCVVCEENSRETLVLPCGHNVACKSCSDKLRNTNNATKCIYCRTDIDVILADGIQVEPMYHKELNK